MRLFKYILTLLFGVSLAVAGSVYAGQVTVPSSPSLNSVLTGLANGNYTTNPFLPIAAGGTSTSTAPTYGQVLLGDGTGKYALVSTSTLGIAAASIIAVETLTSSGAWTPPAGVSSIEIVCTGGGASGATGNGSANWGSGGGAGGTGIAFDLNVGLAGSVSYTIGAGGASVNGTSLTGNNGNATSFGSFCTAGGGNAGTTPGSSLGGAGGTATVGQTLITGGDGVSGGANANFKGGNGGGSYWGGGANFGVTGAAYGSGGGGNTNALASGAGAPGVIVLYEYGNASGIGNSVAGTAGQVQFNLSNSTLGADTRFFWNNSTKKLGIASTTPFAPLSIHALNGDTNLTLFAIGSSTQSATTTLFSVDNVGNTTQLASSTITGGIAAAGNQFRVSATNGGVGITGPFAASPLLTLRATADAGTVPCIEQIISSSGGTMFCIAENSGNNLGILSGVTRIDGMASINLSHTGPPDSNANINLASSNMLIGVDTAGGTHTYIQSAQNTNLLFHPTSNSVTGFSIGSVSEVGATVSIGNPVNFPHLVSFQIASSTNTGTTTQLSFLNTGFMGLGSTTPWGMLSVNANGLSNGAPQFVVGSSTATNLIVANGGNVGIATTSPAFPFSVNSIGKDFYIKTTGEVVGTDATNAFEGIISPTHRLTLSTGTTTAWTASTTGSAYSPFVVAPFSGTVKAIYCLTDQSFLGVNLQVNGSNVTPSYFVASTTPGVVPLTAGNTFTRGQKILMNVGTTTTAATLSLSCTLDVTETP